MDHGPEKGEGPQRPRREPTISAMELRRSELVKDASYTFPHYGKAANYEEAVGRTAADMQSAINRAPPLGGHRERSFRGAPCVSERPASRHRQPHKHHRRAPEDLSHRGQPLLDDGATVSGHQRLD